MRATSADLIGKGIFTTVAIFNGTPWLWEKHWRRLTGNAERVGIDLSEHPEENIRKALCDEIETRNLLYGRARITFYDERPSQLWVSENVLDHKTSLMILTGDWRSTPEPFNLTISPFPANSRSPLAGVKSCNYLEQTLSLDEAKSRGFHEAVRVNERGEITSGCMANIFWLKDDLLFTSSVKTGCLAGTTREFVMENLECRVVDATIDELFKADAMFLTSAGLGVVQVAEFEAKKLNAIQHPISDLLP